MMGGEIFFAFTVGAVSSVNPCGFALLPAFFARRLGIDGATSGNWAANVGGALPAGGAAAAGVVLAFALAGAAILAGFSWLGNALPWAGLTIGVILVGVAIYVLVGHHIGLRIPLPTSWARATGARGDFLFGFGYGIASLSCTFPIFLSITAIATTGSFVQSLASFVAFGLGMGTVIMAIAVAAALSRSGLANALKRLLPFVNRFSGAILLLAGLYVVIYWTSALFSDDPFNPPSIIAAGEDASSWLVSVVGGTTGTIILGSLFVLFAGGLGAVLWRRQRKGTRNAAITPSEGV
ncbi:MAG: cytochrome c biogenesis CcdA family protein [Alphaproteobacteria bacterium]